MMPLWPAGTESVRAAATHHYGDPSRGIPERPILGVSDDDETHILRLAREHLESVINRTA